MQTGALPTLALGGTAVTLASTSFDPHLTLAEIERNGANRLVIVGDASVFLTALRAKYPNIEVVPLSSLNIDSVTLR